MNKINKENQLIMAEHNEKGIWYFSSSTLCCLYCEISQSGMWNTLRGLSKQCKGWKLSIVENDGSIPRQWIDPKVEQENE